MLRPACAVVAGVLVAGCISAPEPGSLAALKNEQRSNIRRECMNYLHTVEFRERKKFYGVDKFQVCHTYAKRAVP